MNEPNPKSFRIVVWLATAAVMSSVALLIASVVVSADFHSYLSSVPLALAGITYAVHQLRLRLSRTMLIKRLVLAAAFVGWAVDQLLPAGPVAVLLGDAVIFGFVLDVAWLIRDQILSEKLTQTELARESPATSGRTPSWTVSEHLS
jgi:hypothetical protein